MSCTLVLLPGLDGTGQLFAPLCDALPAGTNVVEISYPRKKVLTYTDLLPIVRQSLPDEPYILVAESFSGPLGILLAAQHPPDLEGMVLCATFLQNPLPYRLRWLRRFVLPQAFRLPIPRPLLRHLLLDRTAPVEQVEWIRRAIDSVRPEVLAARLREALEVDVSRFLPEITVPMLYLSALNDKLIGRRGERQMAAASPDIQIERLRGPHLLLQANPAECIAEIKRSVWNDWFK